MTRIFATLVRRSVAGAALLGLMALGACADIDAQTTQFVGTVRYPPVDPAHVQILQVEPPQQHLRLGEVSIDATISPAPPQAQLEQTLREEAAQLGADAVVVMYDHVVPSGAYISGPRWGRTLQTISSRKIIGLAIKYANG